MTHNKTRDGLRNPSGRKVWFATGVLVCACGANATDVPGEDEPAANEEATEQTQQALPISFIAEAHWVQGEPWVDLGPATEKFCFLTRVQGHFEGAGEQVQIQVINGRWSLGGFSSQQGVGAGARCVPLRFGNRSLGFSVEFPWNQGDPAKQMLADNGFNACLLTMVRGHFEGNGEHVEITRSNGSWFLGGGSSQQGVSARARCVMGVVVGERRTFARECLAEACDIVPLPCIPSLCSDVPPAELGPFIVAPGIASACGLAGMSGKFEGGAEVARVYLNNSKWFLDARGSQDSIYMASSYCFL